MGDNSPEQIINDPAISDDESSGDEEGDQPIAKRVYNVTAMEQKLENQTWSQYSLD